MLSKILLEGLLLVYMVNPPPFLATELLFIKCPVFEIES